ncbi:hypothetical protein [Fulvitalea axinellae]
MKKIGITLLFALVNVMGMAQTKTAQEVFDFTLQQLKKIKGAETFEDRRLGETEVYNIAGGRIYFNAENYMHYIDLIWALRKFVNGRDRELLNKTARNYSVSMFGVAGKKRSVYNYKLDEGAFIFFRYDLPTYDGAKKKYPARLLWKAMKKKYLSKNYIIKPKANGSNKKAPEYYVDGKKVNQEEAVKINPLNIAHIEIVRDGGVGKIKLTRTKAWRDSSYHLGFLHINMGLGNGM